MALVDPQFGDFQFSSKKVLVEMVRVSADREVQDGAAALADSGASSLGRLTGRRVSLDLDIRGATQDEVRDNLSELYRATGVGKRDLHLDPQYTGRHLLAQRVGEAPMQMIVGTGGDRVKVTMEFLADHPYWIGNTGVTQAIALSSTSVQANIDLSDATTYGNAEAIPTICYFAIGTTALDAGKSIKITNTSTQPNEVFRYKATTAMGASSGKLGCFDGESGDVLWDGAYELKNLAGKFLTLQGGIVNVVQVDLDASGNNGLNSTLTVCFSPRWS